MDVAALQKSARFFVGEHDFLSFAATDPDLASRQLGFSPERERTQNPPLPAATRPSGAVRTIFSSDWEERSDESGDFLVYRVRGNGFLHHMVRNLVGTMLDVGRGHLEMSAIPVIIAARARSAAGPTAPPQGLFLHSVEYPPI
jgi:tRNA pseudouridine38-40 synthase